MSLYSDSDSEPEIEYFTGPPGWSIADYTPSPDFGIFNAKLPWISHLQGPLSSLVHWATVRECICKDRHSKTFKNGIYITTHSSHTSKHHVPQHSSHPHHHSPNTITHPTPSLTSHHHSPHTITPSLTLHHTHLTPSLTSYHHSSHTITSSLTSCHHSLHTITHLTPSLTSHHHTITLNTTPQQYCSDCVSQLPTYVHTYVVLCSCFTSSRTRPCSVYWRTSSPN